MFPFLLTQDIDVELLSLRTFLPTADAGAGSNLGSNLIGG
jgi:hypothetical protein